ncbi:type IV pilin protein [Gallaecimonas sp. GXIMD4217]|uniref:type IV pilin protein n=1 Tax=Gallaecimonas sp. GXIMD4217 TaxID=3131927 RepID=UPI00311B3266
MKQRGFTLMELMITVAIVGIIAAVAYPSYTAHLAKSRRAQAQAELVRLVNLQEQYYLDHRSYAGDLTKLGEAANPLSVAEGHFSISATASAGTMTLTAAAGSDQQKLDGDCAKLMITHAGSKTSKNKSGGDSNGCW